MNWAMPRRLSTFTRWQAQHVSQVASEATFTGCLSFGKWFFKTPRPQHSAILDDTHTARQQRECGSCHGETRPPIDATAPTFHSPTIITAGSISAWSDCPACLAGWSLCFAIFTAISEGRRLPRLIATSSCYWHAWNAWDVTVPAHRTGRRGAGAHAVGRRSLLQQAEISNTSKTIWCRQRYYTSPGDLPRRDIDRSLTRSANAAAEQFRNPGPR